MMEERKNAIERQGSMEVMARKMAGAMEGSKQKKKDIAVMLTNSFIAGLEAGREMEKTAV